MAGRTGTLSERPGPAHSFGTRAADLDWIDGFVESIRPYVRTRPEDRVLIRMPTDVFRLNRTALELLDRALAGEPIERIARTVGALENPERLFQIHTFFCDVRDLVSGHLGDGRGRLGTTVTRFQGSFTRYPVLSEIAVTYRCNLACAFCYAGCGTPGARPGNAARERRPRRGLGARNGRQHRDPVRGEMTRAEVCRVIEEIATAGKVPSVSFTGGECTLRPELPDFVRHARAAGLRVNIITNGIRCASREYTDTLVAAGLTSAQVSLEGPDAAAHERLARRRGAFARTVKGIENLRDAGLHVHTNTTVCQANAACLCDIIDLARKLGLPHVSMNLVIPTGTPTLPGQTPLRVPYSRIGDLVLAARDHAARAGIGFHWYSPTPFCLFNPIAHGLGNKGCAACDGLLHVSPTGEVLPCSSFATGVGNLLEEGFDAVWFGREARWYRQKRQAPALCRSCEHFALCQGACTLYWSELGHGELYRANHHRPGARIRSLLGKSRGGSLS